MSSHISIAPIPSTNHLYTHFRAILTCYSRLLCANRPWFFVRRCRNSSLRVVPDARRGLQFQRYICFAHLSIVSNKALDDHDFWRDIENSGKFNENPFPIFAIAHFSRPVVWGFPHRWIDSVGGSWPTLALAVPWTGGLWRKHLWGKGDWLWLPRLVDCSVDHVKSRMQLFAIIIIWFSCNQREVLCKYGLNEWPRGSRDTLVLGGWNISEGEGMRGTRGLDGGSNLKI